MVSFLNAAVLDETRAVTISDGLSTGNTPVQNYSISGQDIGGLAYVESLSIQYSAVGADIRGENQDGTFATYKLDFTASVNGIPVASVSNIENRFTDFLNAGELQNGPFSLDTVSTLDVYLPQNIDVDVTLAHDFRDGRGASWRNSSSVDIGLTLTLIGRVV